MSKIDARTERRPAPATEQTPSPESRWWVRPAGYVAGVAFVVLVVAVAFWLVSDWGDERPASRSRAESSTRWQRPVVSEAGLAERIGVRIEHVSVSGGGGLVDLRFQVVDPDKAAAVHDRGAPAAVVDESTGVVVNALLMGHAHTAPFKPGVTYYLVFENPGNLVHRGSDVSVLLGNAQVEHVVVE
jgi:hypothetical protein